MKKQKEETVKMKFHKDTFYGHDLAYSKDEVADVPVSMRDRWLKRGATLVEDGEHHGLVEKAVETVKTVARSIVGGKDGDKTKDEPPVDETTGLPAVPKSDTEGEVVTDETLPVRPTAGPKQDGSVPPQEDEDKGAKGAAEKNAASANTQTIAASQKKAEAKK